LTSSVCKRVTIGFGTPAGATMHYHEVASNAGRPDSEMVGTSGSAGERFGWAGRP